MKVKSTMASQGQLQERAGLLSGKTALVTGASRGIGAAIAECFAQQGASLLLAARSQDKLEEVSCHEPKSPCNCSPGTFEREGHCKPI